MRQKLSPEDNRRAWRYAALIVLMMLALGAGIVFLVAHDWPEETYLPDEQPLLVRAAQGLDDVRVIAELDPDSRLLTFTQELTLTNRTGVDQTQVVLRSFSGAYLNQSTSPAATDALFFDCYGAAFDPGGLTLTRARIDGGMVIWHWLDDAQTVLALPAQWPVNGSVTVTLECAVDIPECAGSFGHARDVFMLGQVFPVPALWEDGAWRMDAPAAFGPPTVSACANWDVTLTVPAGYTAAASVQAEPEQDGVVRRYHFRGKALRDFALAISDRYVMSQRMAGDTIITAYALTQEDADRLADVAVQAFDSFSSRWGAYAWPTFTLAEAPLPWDGSAFHGLAVISSGRITEGGSSLELTAARMTAQQWWGAMVGSDGVYQPWQSLSLCEYALMDYIGDAYGASDRADAVFDRIDTSLRMTIPRGLTPGSPIDSFSGPTQLQHVAGQRGAALWMALETHLGKDALDALLREYQTCFRFGLATRDDLTRLISQHTGQDLSMLMIDYLDTYMY